MKNFRKTFSSAMLGCALAIAATGVARAHGPEIRWTTDGIPHVKAHNWHDLGVGVGYAQAGDALCTMAEVFLTVEGQRAFYFGPQGHPAFDSTFGTASNLDLDFFFRAFASDDVVARYRAQQPRELDELVQGFAAGYDRYLSELTKSHAAGKHACQKEAWLHPITADDVYRRMYATHLAAGYARFVAGIVNAAPPSAESARHAASHVEALQARLSQPVGDQAGLGSNAIAFGRQATGEQGGVLLGNPHWYWGGPDRYYQMQLTIPGQIDVAGVSFLGIPLVMIGFNDHIAWSHTVSKARRFGFFDVKLDPDHPTRYSVDGVMEDMKASMVTVDSRDEQGGVQHVSRTLYSTRFGPVVDLGAFHPDLAWSASHALVMRDINAENFRVYRNFLRWGQARSLDEFIGIQREESAIPWVNTLAIGRGDGRAWYSEMGAAPNVPDALRQRCATPLAQIIAYLDPVVPVLDGSRAACDWQVDASAAQHGAFPAKAMPSLSREDYVANMNDSHWLSNPAQPLEGYPQVLGDERHALSLRGRLGHEMAQSLVARQGPRSAEGLSRQLMAAALLPRSYPAESFKAGLLDGVCAQKWIVLSDSGSSADKAADKAADKTAAVKPVQAVDVGQACAIMKKWSNVANAQDKGALLWDAFWRRLADLPENVLYATPFSADHPLDTPREPRASDSRVAQALARTVKDFSDRGWALDASVATQRFVRNAGRTLPLYGGCHEAGYFVVACNENEKSESRDAMDGHAHANSYMQVVWFGADGVHASTLLAHGQKEGAVDNGPADAAVRRYARKDWLRFPFHERDIEHDAGLKVVHLAP
ncbi:MAG: penicillin acylase family protein [Aquabacterium sp.]